MIHQILQIFKARPYRRQIIPISVDFLRQYATLKNISSKTTRSKASTPTQEIPKQPKRPGNTYTIFFAENFKKIKAENPELKVPEIGKKCAERWKSLSDSEKNVYQEVYRKAKSKFEDDLQHWCESLTPADYVRENEQRKLKNLKPLKDPRMPKKPKTAFLHFYITNMDVNDGKSMIDRIKSLSQEWKMLSLDDKKPFIEEQAKDRDRYKAEIEEYKKLLVQ